MTLLVAMAMVALPLGLWLTTARRPAIHPRPIDIGLLFATVVALYGAAPLVGIALAQAGIGTLQEQRLGEAMPEPQDVLQIGTMYLLFLVGFVVGYRAFVPSEARSAIAELVSPQPRHVLIVVLLYAGVQAGMLVIRLVYGVSSGEDYLDSYAELYGLPLAVQQVLGLLAAIDFAIAVLLIVAVVAWRPRYHFVVAAFVLILIAQTFVVGGSRSYAFMCGLAYLVARSIYGPRLKAGSVAVVGLIGLSTFLLAGVVRQSRLDSEAVSWLSLAQGGEFVALFYNGLDMLEKAELIRSTELSFSLYFVDLLRLVPRQFVGDVKVDPAVFYVSTFYPEFHEAGGGLAFGAIAESVIGLGEPEAAVRGLLLGVAYAFVRRQLVVTHISVARAFVYAWFVVLAYQGLRDTTFSVFARFALQVLPVLLLLRLGRVLCLSRGRDTQPMATPPLAPARRSLDG